MKEQIDLHCIHGNLQFPSVWNHFKSVFDLDNFSVNIIAENLWEFQGNTFNQWVEQFIQKLSPHKKSFILGYSLGGRLALHALQKHAQKFSGAVIISADFGIENHEERQNRIEIDQQWGHRFAHDNWDDVINQWNNQGVFSNRNNHLALKEEDFDRTLIEKFFTIFSKGRQHYLKPSLLKTKLPPLLWLVGEEDHKFKHIAEQFHTDYPQGKIAIISDAGHRVPWENRDQFIHEVKSFLKVILENDTRERLTSKE